MAPRAHANYKLRRQKIKQNSPFLDLPGEIRTQIYRAALQKPTPIDLWPAEVILDPSQHPESAQLPSLWPSLLKRAAKRRDPASTKFRYQRDLEYVRKEMATGLLGTCAQVYSEAAPIFWSCNIWRFGGDEQCVGLLYFLHTIGRAARARLRIIEVFPPIEVSRVLAFTTREGVPVAEREYWDAPATTLWKNYPKMHMVKLARYYEDPDDNVQQILRMLGEEKSLREIRFVVPRGWTLDQSQYALVGTTRQRFATRQGFVSHNEPVLNFPTFALVRWLRRVVLFEKEATLKGTAHVNILNEEGLHVVCGKGSRMSVQGGQTDTPEKVAVDLEYPAHTYDLEPLDAVEELFREVEEVSLPAKAGKTNTRSNRADAPRVLKGFGGCRFVYREGWYCINCQESSKYWTQRECCWRADEFTYRSTCTWEWREAIELKKKDRARRLGVIRPSGYPIQS